MVGEFEEELWGHAGRIEKIRERLARVAATVQCFEQDQAAFGRLCGWILTGMGDRHVRQGELIAYIEESLGGWVHGLRRVSKGELRLAGLVGEEPGEDEEPGPAGEIVQGVLEAVESREWVEPQLMAGVPGDGSLAGALAHIEPLRQMLDDLTGMPDLVARQAEHWRSMGIELAAIGIELRDCLRADHGDNGQQPVRAYLAMMAKNVEGLLGLAAVSTAMTMITTAAGDLILRTRDIVRGLLGKLVAQVIAWSTDTTVVPLPVLVARLGLVVSAAWQVDAYLKALVTSIVNLSGSIDG